MSAWVGSLPGKTFLVGEYLAIDGGPSILLATDPRFTLEQGSVSESATGFATASPAGRFLSRHREIFASKSLNFQDPHRGLGGLGASSAQFALLYAAAENIERVEVESFDWKKLLTEYRACAWGGEGLPPSGADLVAQLSGGVTWYDGREFAARSLKWAFKQTSFTLIRTGTKLATHEHLKRAQSSPHETLGQAVREATSAFETNNDDQLINAIQTAREGLEKSGLTAPSTLALLKELELQPWTLAAKGCGAMGADVIALLHAPSQQFAVEAWAKAQRLEICGRLSSLGQGLKVNK